MGAAREAAAIAAIKAAVAREAPKMAAAEGIVVSVRVVVAARAVWQPGERERRERTALDAAFTHVWHLQRHTCWSKAT